VIRLSVIVPYFDVERYAAENLRSLAQNAAPGTEFIPRQRRLDRRDVIDHR
jgi:hypothetical protein